MKGTFFEQFACVACAWYLAGAVDAKLNRGPRRTAVGDDPLKVYQKLGVLKPGIAGCLATAASFNVKIQSLKTSIGSVYSRQLVTAADLPCFENSVTKHLPAATHIGACAEATAREGLNSFLWEGDACTAFLAWRPRTRADCKDGGSKVVYVVKEQLTPFDGVPVVNVSGVIRYESPRAFLDISYHNFCGFGVNVHKGYKLQLNGTEVKRLDEGTTTYSLEYKYLCFTPMNLSLWSVGSDGKVNSNEVQLTINMSSTLRALQTGDCLYLPGNGGGHNYKKATEYCHSVNFSLFYEKVDGEAAAFLKALDALRDFYAPFYVGLRLNRTANRWEWLGGLVQPSVDAEVWGSGQPTSNDYAAASNVHSNWRIFTGQASYIIVCYVSLS